MASNRYQVSVLFKGQDLTSKVMHRMQGNISRDVTRMQDRFKMMNQSIRKTQAGLSSFIRGTTLAMVPAAFAMTNVYKTYAEFERTMVSASAKMGVFRSRSTESRKEFDSLASSVDGVASRTEHTAVQMAKVFELMAQSGFSKTAATGSLGFAADFATAITQPADQAFWYVKRIQGAVGLLKGDGEEIAANFKRVADVTAKAVNMSATNIEEFTEAMKFAGASADLAGMSLEEVAAGVMVLANAGLEGTIAGTGLQRVMTELADPTGKALAVIRGLNVETTELVNGVRHLRKPVEIFSDFGEALNKLDPADRLKALNRVFGLIGLKSSKKLIDGATLSMRDYIKEMGTATGYVDELATEQRKTLSGSWARLVSVIESTKLAIGEYNNVTLVELIDRYTEWIRTHKELVSQFIGSKMEFVLKNIGKIAAGFGALVGLAGGLWMFNQAVFALTTIFKVGAFLKIGTAVSFLVGSLMTAFKWLRMTALIFVFLNPITATIAVLAAIAAAVWYFWDEISFAFKWWGEKIPQWWSSMWDSIKSITKAGVSEVMSLIPTDWSTTAMRWLNPEFMKTLDNLGLSIIGMGQAPSVQTGERSSATAAVTITDETGKAKVSESSSTGRNSSISFQRTGEFAL